MARGRIGFNPKNGHRGVYPAPAVAPLVYAVPQFIGHDPQARPTATANLAVPVTVPTVQAGDMLYIVAEVAINAATFTLAGLTFTAEPASARNGLTSQLWSRKVVSAAESGTVLQVNTSQALTFRAHLTAWRNIASAVVTSINSASTGTLLVPTYTPTPVTVPIQCISVARASGVAADFTPPAGITEVASFNPTTSYVTGTSWGIGTRNTAAGNTWGGQDTFISAGWLITATPTQQAA